MTDKVEELRAALLIAQGEVTRLSRELHDALLAECPIAVGDVVMTVKYGPMFVTKIETNLWRDRDQPWIKGVVRKKDGTWGTQERRVFSDWRPLAE